MLCLEGLPDAFGTRLEKAAWKQPEPVSGLYRRYPKVLDRAGFELCSVKARLLESGRPVVPRVANPATIATYIFPTQWSYLTMLKRRLTIIALSACFFLGLSGCGGGGAKVEAVSTTTTMGQELQDLEAAYQKGIITESEYKTGKKRIMDRYK